MKSMSLPPPLSNKDPASSLLPLSLSLSLNRNQLPLNTTTSNNANGSETTLDPSPPAGQEHSNNIDIERKNKKEVDSGAILMSPSLPSYSSTSTSTLTNLPSNATKSTYQEVLNPPGRRATILLGGEDGDRPPPLPPRRTNSTPPTSSPYSKTPTNLTTTVNAPNNSANLRKGSKLAQKEEDSPVTSSKKGGGGFLSIFSSSSLDGTTTKGKGRLTSKGSRSSMISSTSSTTGSSTGSVSSSPLVNFFAGGSPSSGNSKGKVKAVDTSSPKKRKEGKVTAPAPVAAPTERRPSLQVQLPLPLDILGGEVGDLALEMAFTTRPSSSPTKANIPATGPGPAEDGAMEVDVEEIEKALPALPPASPLDRTLPRPPTPSKSLTSASPKDAPVEGEEAFGTTLTRRSVIRRSTSASLPPASPRALGSPVEELTPSLVISPSAIGIPSSPKKKNSNNPLSAPSIPGPNSTPPFWSMLFPGGPTPAVIEPVITSTPQKELEVKAEVSLTAVENGGIIRRSNSPEAIASAPQPPTAASSVTKESKKEDEKKSPSLMIAPSQHQRIVSRYPSLALLSKSGSGGSESSNIPTDGESVSRKAAVLLGLAPSEVDPKGKRKVSLPSTSSSSSPVQFRPVRPPTSTSSMASTPAPSQAPVPIYAGGVFLGYTSGAPPPTRPFHPPPPPLHIQQSQPSQQFNQEQSKGMPHRPPPAQNIGYGGSVNGMGRPIPPPLSRGAHTVNGAIYTNNLTYQGGQRSPRSPISEVGASGPQILIPDNKSFTQYQAQRSPPHTGPLYTAQPRPDFRPGGMYLARPPPPQNMVMYQPQQMNGPTFANGFRPVLQQHQMGGDGSAQMYMVPNLQHQGGGQFLPRPPSNRPIFQPIPPGMMLNSHQVQNQQPRQQQQQQQHQQHQHQQQPQGQLSQGGMYPSPRPVSSNPPSQHMAGPPFRPVMNQQQQMQFPAGPGPFRNPPPRPLYVPNFDMSTPPIQLLHPHQRMMVYPNEIRPISIPISHPNPHQLQVSSSYELRGAAESSMELERPSSPEKRRQSGESMDMESPDSPEKRFAADPEEALMAYSNAADRRPSGSVEAGSRSSSPTRESLVKLNLTQSNLVVNDGVTDRRASYRPLPLNVQPLTVEVTGNNSILPIPDAGGLFRQNSINFMPSKSPLRKRSFEEGFNPVATDMERSNSVDDNSLVRKVRGTVLTVSTEDSSGGGREGGADRGSIMGGYESSDAGSSTSGNNRYSVASDNRPTFVTIKRQNTESQRQSRMFDAVALLNIQRAEAKVSKDQKVQFEFAKACLAIGDPYVDEGFGVLRKLASAGFPEAHFFLGEAYADDGKHNLAYTQFLMAAKRGYAPACHAIGKCAEVGKGFKKNVRLALEMHTKAATAGNLDSMYRLGRAEMDGDLGLKKDAVKAMKWFKRAAAVPDRDHPEPLFELANIYETGIPPYILQDFSYARGVLQEAVDFGYPPAIYKMGYCYEHGLMGVEVSPAESIRLYTLALNLGYSEALLGMAGWHMTGAEGILPQNKGKAFDLVKEAADVGCLARAQYTLGYFFEGGIGVDVDMEMAFRYYDLAARQGEERAQSRIEKAYGGSRIKSPSSAASRSASGKKNGFFGFLNAKK